MKKSLLIASASIALALSLCACNAASAQPSNDTENTSVVEDIKEEETVTEPAETEEETAAQEPEVSEEIDEPEVFAGPLATVTFTWDTTKVTNTDPTKLTEPGDISDLEIINTDRADAVLTPGELLETKDADGTIIYDELYTIDGNIKTYVCNIYSKDVEFSVEAQPIALQSSGPDYDSTLEIKTNDGEVVTKDGEDLIIRSYTGHHFIGLFTVKDGEVIAWEMPEYLQNGLENIDE